jgi:Phage tail assembly chaperone protein, TAC
VGGSFVEAAEKLAGLSGALLGWRPAEFWAATPAELSAIIAALSPQDEIGDAHLITLLKERFPDG